MPDLECLFNALEIDMTMADVRSCWEYLKEREALTYRFRADHLVRWLGRFNQPSPGRTGLS